MQLRRYVGLVDLGIVTVVAAGIAMPPREMFASPALKANEQATFALALAEARTIAQPTDTNRASDYSHRLDAAGFKDWAVEAGSDGAERASAAPDRWRALFATSIAYINRLEPKPALDYANRALTTCQSVGEAGCPSWENTRIRILRDYLVSARDIDPKKDPQKFLKMGDGGIRTIRIGGTSP